MKHKKAFEAIGVYTAFPKFTKLRKIILCIAITGRLTYSSVNAQVNYNLTTCSANSLKLSSSLGDSVRTSGFSAFGAGYRIFIEGDTTYGIGNNIYIHKTATNAFGIGSGIALNPNARNAYAFGNAIGIGANMVFAIGSYIKSNYSNTITVGIGTSNNVVSNSVPGSFIVSMNSTSPSLFVGSGYGAEIGKVGIATTMPGSNLQINGNCAIGYNSPTIAPTNGLLVNGDVGVNGIITLQTVSPGNSANGSIAWDGNGLLFRRNNNWESLNYYGPWDTTETTVSTLRNVAIGVDMPNTTAALEVNGYINLHEKKPLSGANGCIIWSGSDFLGRKGGKWVSLTGEGTEYWQAGGNGIYTSNHYVGINTVPQTILHIKSFIENNVCTPATIRLETTENPNTEPYKTDIVMKSNGDLSFVHQDKEVLNINSNKTSLNNQLYIKQGNTNSPDIYIMKEGQTNYPSIRLEQSYNDGGGTGGGTDAVINNAYDIKIKDGALKFNKNIGNNQVEIISMDGSNIYVPSTIITRIDGKVGIGITPVSNNKFAVSGYSYFMGNIGVGTNQPNSPIHIKGLNTAITLENTNNSPSESAKVIFKAGGGAGRIISNKDFAIFIDSDHNQTDESFQVITNDTCYSNNAVSLMQVNSTGTTISNKLTVDGNMVLEGKMIFSDTLAVGDGILIFKDGRIWAQKKIVVANQCPWTDYVFEKDYQLMPIKDLKKYVTEEKHLPEVPTTKDVETNGQDLGAINVILLKKIEELTLYMLEQNDKIEKLEKDIETLKKNNNGK